MYIEGGFATVLLRPEETPHYSGQIPPVGLLLPPNCSPGADLDEELGESL